jgi:HK97 family phage major capsid protein
MKTNNFFFCGNKVNQDFHRSMRHRYMRYGSASFKADAPGDDADDEEKKKLLLEVRNAAKEELKGSKMFTEFENMQKDWAKLPLEAVRALCDKETGVLARFSRLDAKILELETAAKGSSDRPLSLRGQIEKYCTDNKDIITSIRNKQKKELPPFEFNMDLFARAVASPMLPSNTYLNTTYLPPITWDWTVNEPLRPTPTFWDYIPKGNTDSPAFGWVNKKNIQGAAGFVAPGQLKPNISFQLDVQISTYRKIAVTDKVAQELLWDIPQFESMVRNELRYQILIKVNTALMSGTGSTTDPTGIQKLSVAYTLTGIKTNHPNYFDALRAVVAQMRSGYLTGDITIFINPIDAANMDMTKATTSGVYMLPSFVTNGGKIIAGATIVEDYSIPVGHFQAAFLAYYKILIYKPLIVTFGWENDDFTKNLITYLAEMALHQMFNTQYTGAFVYDTYANVLAAIDSGAATGLEAAQEELNSPQPPRPGEGATVAKPSGTSGGQGGGQAPTPSGGKI